MDLTFELVQHYAIQPKLNKIDSFFLYPGQYTAIEPGESREINIGVKCKQDVKCIIRPIYNLYVKNKLCLLAYKVDPDQEILLTLTNLNFYDLMKKPDVFTHLFKNKCRILLEPNDAIVELIVL